MKKRPFGRATVALALALSALPAAAFRPFDSTDADVAELDHVEIEAGLGRTRIGEVDSLALPSLVLNYGLMPDTEIVLEGQLTHEAGTTADDARNRLDETSLSMKHVWRRGSLQDEAGLSVATECAVLLPEGHGGSRTGGECAAIVSQKWDAGALHLNLGLGRTRERDAARTVGLIVEGPGHWAVRPVAELLAERDTGHGGRLDSALAGAIWQRGEDLAFDVGVRRARTQDGRFTELRVGLTWSFEAAK